MNAFDKLVKFMDGKNDINVHTKYVEEFKEFLGNDGIKNYYTRSSEHWTLFTTVTRSQFELSTVTDDTECLLTYIRDKNKEYNFDRLISKREELEDELEKINQEIQEKR